ncbi:MAG: choice-of-anchor J domain-containing protein [Cyclobacteriaceae bacterium]|nr:choice-of-anchor J domain-containing protein [Cyclobacteriaceae bacterium]
MTGRTSVIFWSAIFLGLIALPVYGQERCSTTEYENLRRARVPRRESPAQFEQWIQSRLAARSNTAVPAIASTYTIPVVVHILYNGINDITNISDAQILSQIDVLNKDFKRLNLDAVNTPPEFLPVAGSIDIEFVLAKRDPEGRATNGIVRVQSTKPQWSMTEQSEFKALSYWAAENYLNIWVVNFGTNDIGYAQFPVSNTLAGLETASDDRLTDGIVVDYRAFGSVDDGAFPLTARFNKGRTATHEIGHFLGLRHIWGDVSSCGDNDFVPDTPPQSGATYFCPSYPQASCSSNKMFMNYMDYTDDACMNIFTAGQIARMQVILAESPRRASLLTSSGATPPLVVSNDLGIRAILSPGAVSCANPVVPQLEVRNYGTNLITAAQISLSVNGVITETRNVALNLTPDQVTNVSFNTVGLTQGTSNSFQFNVLQTNGGTDGNTENNQALVQVTVPVTASLPLNEVFNSMPSNWMNLNPDNQIGWTNVLAADNSPTNRAMKLDFYNYENQGVLDYLLSPAFTLSAPANALLKFDIAYAQYPGQPGDALKVYALPGCNLDLSQGILLYSKSGADLSTTSSTSNPFVPTNNNQWRKSEILTLAGLNASTPWQLAFVGLNGYSNNLYLDNVQVSVNEIIDIALAGVVSPGIVHCKSNPMIQFKVSNLGTTTVTQFKIEYAVNNDAPQTQVFSNINLNVGETKTFTLNAISLLPGPNQVLLTVSLPNGIPDIQGNNVFNLTSVLDQSVDRGPLRMTFDNPGEQSWRVASPSNSLDWQSVATNKDKSLAYRSFTNPAVGEESWLVSPVLDLREGTFSMFFDVSYAQNMPADDRLKILASTDCGVTYDQVIIDRPASSFTTASSSSEWFPGNNDDWRREYVDIGNLANLSSVRIAFVAQNDNGNNLFIDNIELFAGDDPNPPTTPALYQFYYSSQYTNSDVALTINLPKRQDLQLQILSIQGKLVADYLLTDALNQTYYFDLSNQSSGLYLFRLFIDGRPSVSKVFISH